MRVGRTMIRGSISNIAAVSATEISARKPLARPSMPYAGTHKGRIDSKRVTPQTAAKIARDQNTPRNMTSRRRRHTKDPRTNAVAKKAPATMASEMAFSQINSGFHSRHAPCGMSVDMSIRSPIRVSTGLTATPSVRRDDGSNHSGFREPRKRAAARRASARRYRSHQNAPADDRSPASRRVGVHTVVKLPGPEQQQGWTRSKVSPLDHNLDEAGNGSHARPQLGIRSDDGAVVIATAA